MAKSAKFLTGLTIILFGFVRMLWLVLWLGAVCAWCMIQTLALVVGEFCSRWSNANCQSLVCVTHQDDFARFTCIGYRKISE